MKFTESFLTELEDRNDIYDVVSSYVQLGKRSGSNYFGLCPFHNEKTPSFSVAPDKQIYYCFGCGKGGNVITFIEEIEGLNFPEAVEFLAKRANIPMPQAEDDPSSRMRSRILALNKDAARFFHDCLLTETGQPARSYVAKRKISPSTVTNFGLGYAPDDWHSLHEAMRSKGYTDEELLTADLIRRNASGHYYDTFRNRLIFPVINVNGNVVAFSGRYLGDDDKGPKYLNSKDTPVYNKGKNLFGLNLAKKSKSDYLILVEGNVDVVSLHQAGFDSAVASLGTALTQEQSRLLSRFKNKVVIAYDNDTAGINAAQKAIKILEKLDVEVKVLRMDGAKDPDEFIKANGAGAFRNLIEKSESQSDYLLQNILKKYDLSVDEQKINFIKEADYLIAGFPSEVSREVYAMRVAELTNSKPETIIRDVDKKRKSLLANARKKEQSVESFSRDITRGFSNIKYEDPESAAAEEGLIRLLYLDPGLVRSKDITSFDSALFSSDTLRHIYNSVRQLALDDSSVPQSVLSGELSSEEMSLFVGITMKPENLSAGNALKDYIKKISERHEQRNTSGVNLNDYAEQLRKKGKAYK